MGVLAAGVCGCGGGTPSAASLQALDWSRTAPFGVGPAFAPAVSAAAARAGAPVGGLRCGAAGARVYGAHLELFAAGRIVRVAAGIGLAPPLRLQGGRVVSARCAYPIRTLEPTGVVEVDARFASVATVGRLFALWGQELGPRRLAGFAAGAGRQVVAFVDGRRFAGDPRSIPLSPHAQIVLEVGPAVSPHPSYRFPAGL